jgi:hypothetical protein
LLGQLFAVDQPFRLRIGADEASGQKHLSSRISIAAPRPAWRACHAARLLLLPGGRATHRVVRCVCPAARALYPVAFSYG